MVIRPDHRTGIRHAYLVVDSRILHGTIIGDIKLRKSPEEVIGCTLKQECDNEIMDRLEVVLKEHFSSDEEFEALIPALVIMASRMMVAHTEAYKEEQARGN